MYEVFNMKSAASIAGVVLIVGIARSDPEPAPEFAKIAAWINSEPLKVADLKGKVVVIHFWTHGCINCINNYPHYRKWVADFKDKDMTMVGVHTPEFDREKDLDRIKKKIKENDLTFPVAVDNKGATWAAWRNRYWPCVYLVDRTGTVRYHWEGELGEKGEAIMRKRLEELLAEGK
jgi:peroxiredoxin